MAIMGKTGSGKSTLCLLANGVIPHVIGGKLGGSIHALGRSTLDHRVYELAKDVGMVLQDPESQLFTSSVRSEVAFAGENLGLSRSELIERVRSSLAAVRLDGFEDRVPGGLSGGQKQRLAIASSLVVRPRLLVLDEPTSQLDPIGTAGVFEVVRNLNREHGVTIILATHKSEEVAEFSDRIVVLDRGSIVAEGGPAKVFSRVKRIDGVDLHVPAVTLAELKVGLAGDNRSVILAASHQRFADALGSGEIRIRENTRTEEPPEAETSASSHPNSSPAISLDQISYSYRGGDAPAIDALSLEIRRGEFAGLIGQNGAGKSTLAKLMLGLFTPSRGEVRVLGESIQNISSFLGRRIGLVLQNPDHQLFALTAADEVAFGLKNCGYSGDELEQLVDKALETAGLAEQRDSYPYNMSLADRRKLSVAAVAAPGPEILIFDEPSTGQDPAGRRALAGLAAKMNEAGATVLMISHDMELISEYTSRLIVMGRGKILADGPTREIFQMTDLLASTYIAPPQITRLSHLLRPFGLTQGILTVSEFCEAIEFVREPAI